MKRIARAILAQNQFGIFDPQKLAKPLKKSQKSQKYAQSTALDELYLIPQKNRGLTSDHPPQKKPTRSWQELAPHK